MRLPQLIAEALAWPLRDPDAFQRGDVHASPLGRDARKALASAPAPLNTPQAEDAWRLVFPACPANVRAALLRFAERTLEPWGHGLRLVRDREEPGLEILRWRWLSLALPPGLLLAAATPETLSPDPWLAILPSVLRPEGLCAHLHVHLGAVYPFEVLWSHLSTSLDPRFIATSKVAPPGFTADEWPCWLVRALLARRVLAERLLDVERPQALDIVAEIADEALAMDELRTGRLVLRDPRREAALLRLLQQRERTTPSPESEGQIWTADALFRGARWPEGRLLQAGLRAQDLREAEERLFVQMLRVKVALYRLLVSDPTRPGLGSFVQTYDRIQPYEGELGAAALNLATSDPGVPLDAVEVRVAPGPVGRLLDQVAPRRASPDPCSHEADLEWAYIVHFIRWRAPRGQAADEPGIHLRQLVDQHLAKAQTLARTLAAWPQLLTVIRGLDVAGDERKGPLWLVLPALRRVLGASSKIAGDCLAGPPLRMTLHAGEDYAHLLTGVRAVMEPFEWGLLGPGDRLGHALALGELPDRWFERHPKVLQPRFERLHDLLWALDMVARCECAVTEAVLLRWQDEIMGLAQAIWGRQVPVETLRRLRRAFGDPEFLPSLPLDGTPHSRPTPGRDLAGSDLTAELAVQLLAPGPASRAAWETIGVEARRDEEATKVLQHRVRQHVARALVCVELNPSSNLLIGDLSAPLDQPMFQLRPVNPRVEADAPVIPVTLNADDPLCFTTSLSDELAYTWTGLVHHAEIEPSYATEWLNDAARTSWRHRFSLPQSRALRCAPPGVPGREWWRPTRD